MQQNILKYRAFEMMLSLFYAEDLKRFLVSTIESTQRWHDNLATRPIVQKNVNYATATDQLFKNGHISSGERDEIRKIVGFRNKIAHELHMLTFDIGRSPFVRGMLEHQKYRYDYKILERLEFYCQELPERLGGEYMQVLSFDSLLFEAAEKTYKSEIRTLRKKIDRQIAVRKQKIELLKKELSLSGLPEDLHPDYPSNRRKNGNLSKRGIEVCYRLYDAQKSPLAVAYLMKISKVAARAHQKIWFSLGGTQRTKQSLAPIALSQATAAKK